ncbi:MAG: RNA polymerase sigma factor, partial [Acidobacteriota bacterium]
MQASEVELTQRLLAGDETALAPLLETIQRKVFQYTWLMCGQREDAEEVAQDTLLKVSQNWRQLQDPQRIKSWMFSIARNCCLMKRRKSVFAPAAEIPVDDLPLTTSEPDPETQLLQHEITAELEAALRLLPDTYRAVLLLRD